MGESGRRASIEWLLRPRLGLGFALLPSLSLPRRSTLPLPAAAAGLPSPGASCRGGERSELAARPPGQVPQPPAGRMAAQASSLTRSQLACPCNRPGGLRFHVHIKRRPGGWGEPAAGGGGGAWRLADFLLQSARSLHAWGRLLARPPPQPCPRGCSCTRGHCMLAF